MELSDNAYEIISYAITMALGHFVQGTDALEHLEECRAVEHDDMVVQGEQENKGAPQDDSPYEWVPPNLIYYKI